MTNHNSNKTCILNPNPTPTITKRPLLPQKPNNDLKSHIVSHCHNQIYALKLVSLSKMYSLIDVGISSSKNYPCNIKFFICWYFSNINPTISLLATQSTLNASYTFITMIIFSRRWSSTKLNRLISPNSSIFRKLDSSSGRNAKAFFWESRAVMSSISLLIRRKASVAIFSGTRFPSIFFGGQFTFATGLWEILLEIPVGWTSGVIYSSIAPSSLNTYELICFYLVFALRIAMFIDLFSFLLRWLSPYNNMLLAAASLNGIT